MTTKNVPCLNMFYCQIKISSNFNDIWVLGKKSNTKKKNY